MSAAPTLVLAVGGPQHGHRIPAFPSGPTRHVVDQGTPDQVVHTYRPQRMEHIAGAPVVLMHESITGRARIETYADAVTRDRDALLVAAGELLQLTDGMAVPLINLTELVKAAGV